jgi:hypothetical protein
VRLARVTDAGEAVVAGCLPDGLVADAEEALFRVAGNGAAERGNAQDEGAAAAPTGPATAKATAAEIAVTAVKLMAATASTSFRLRGRAPSSARATSTAAST